MAELMLSAFLDLLFENLASAAFASLEQLAAYKEIDPSEIQKLQRYLLQIRDVLVDASHKEITTSSVKRWLNDLQHLAYDIDDLLDDLATDAMHFDEAETLLNKVIDLLSCCVPRFSLRSRTANNKLHDINTKLQDLVGDNLASLGLTVKEETRPIIINRKFQSSIVDESRIVGRQEEKEAFVQLLLLPSSSHDEQSYSIVPILGMGGVGKTTLARLLYDKKKVKDHFELKAWLCFSDEFDILDITKKIFEAVRGETNKKPKSFNEFQEALRNLLRGKTFLFVFDDMWNVTYADWETLVKPFYICAPGSKIIITTRKSELIEKLGYNLQNKQLESLSDDDALSLVARHALGVNTFDSHLSLKPHAQDIVKKCGGLPLALIALGRLLRTKKDEPEEWKEILNNEIWELPVQGEIIPALLLSYNDLSAPLKRLFAYCSLFPKDFLFNKEELVLVWMAEGFLHQPTTRRSTNERLGREYFDDLLSRSFFQHAPNNESLFVMHDLMNDLATYVAGEVFVRVGNETEEMVEKYRHMSFVSQIHVGYKKFEVFERATSLRTLFVTSAGVGEMFYLSNKILFDLVPKLQLLRVLSLRGFLISEVPDSIGTLKHLRYLNLSHTLITSLPENVSNLYNLETLILAFCEVLTKLPSSFLKLKKLRHLDVTETPLLVRMPIGIDELRSAQTLSKIIIGNESGFEIAKLKNFENLCGKISIKGLEKLKTQLMHVRRNFH